MFTRFKQSKLFFWTEEIVLTIIGIYFILQMANIFKPLIGMASAILVPLIVAGFLYYMFDPIVVFFRGKRWGAKGDWISPIIYCCGLCWCSNIAECSS